MSWKGEHRANHLFTLQRHLAEAVPGCLIDLSQSILLSDRETDFSQFRTVRVEYEIKAMLCQLLVGLLLSL